MSKKILLIGNGAREHAIAKKIVESQNTLFSYMSKENPGIADLSKRFTIGDLNNFEKLKKFKSVDYAIVGPENPLAAGITNHLEDKLEIPTCGPRKEVAKIESSKIFTRYLLDIYDIPGNVPYTICKAKDDLETVVQEFGKEFVVKPDGLTGGKGVKVFGDHFSDLNQVEEYAASLLRKDKEFLIEEKIHGGEFSLQVFTDGKSVIPMPLVRDYKRAYDDDKGPNTGSMGSYSLTSHNLPFVEKRDKEKALDIIKKTVDALYQHTNVRYKGILYGQFMKTNDKIYLIEFNVRFGDPEALNVLKLLNTNFGMILEQIIDGNLGSVNYDNLATVCTYLVPNGYPTNPIQDASIEIDPSINSDVYFASVYRKKNSVYTTKSRALALIETGSSLEEARAKIQKNLPKIKGKLFHRTDIGKLL